MKLSKEVLLLLIAGFILTIIFVGTFLLFQQSSEKAPKITPTPTSAFLDKDPITYNTEASKKAWDLVKEKQQLSAQDAQAKTKLITDNITKDGVVYQSPNVTVDYTKPFDMFQATITTPNIAKAKEEVVAWFKSKGLSQDGICNLPLIFDIDLFTAQSLKGQNIVFDPLPPGCQ